MRHIVSGYNCHGLQPYTDTYIKPYAQTKFANATLKKTYCKVLQHVASHDGCKRVDITIAVLGDTSNKWKQFASKNGIARTREAARGQHSTMYSQLLYLDLIDYDKSYRYHITDKGREVLKNAYLNDMSICY